MEIVRDTPFEVGYTVFQVRPPQNALIVVVKATFDLRSDGDCTVAAEQRSLYGEQYADDDATRDMLYPGDMAPAKPRGEYHVLGTCYPPGGTARTSAVAFRVGALQKGLAVFGDRHWGTGLSRTPSEPEPFTAMPLRWSRAFGGPEVEQNPVGKGTAQVETSAGQRVALPNIENPQMLVSTPADRPLPACCRPVSPTWLPRRAQQGTFDKRWFETRWPWWPEDFRLEFFNCAPGDQQLRTGNYWRGDEELALKNMHPERMQLNTKLPGLRPRAFVLPRAGGMREVALQLDTIVVDADNWQVQCVWRGNTDVRSLKPRELAALFVGHETIYETQPDEHWSQRYAVATAPPAEEQEPAEEPPPEAPPPAVEPDEDNELELFEASLREQGLLPPPPPPDAAPKAPPEKPGTPEEQKQLLEKLGIDVTPEIEELLRDEEPPAPEEPPATRDVRAEVLALIAAGQPLKERDFSEGDLSELDLHGQDLTGAILSKCNLRGANLEEAKLVEAQLGEADLTAARLTKADLTKADLTSARLDAAVLEEAVLEEAVLEQAVLTAARLVKAKAAKARFVAANLTRAVAHEADFTEADLGSAVLDEADFTKSVMPRVTLAGTMGVRTRFDECDLSEARGDERTAMGELHARYAKAPNATFRGGEFNKSNWSFSDMERADFGDCALVQARFDGCAMSGALFEDAVLVGATAVKANLAECMMDGADLSHADLRGANLFSASLWRAKLTNTEYTGAIVSRTILAPNI